MSYKALRCTHLDDVADELNKLSEEYHVDVIHIDQTFNGCHHLLVKCTAKKKEIL